MPARLNSYGTQQKFVRDFNCLFLFNSALTSSIEQCFHFYLLPLITPFLWQCMCLYLWHDGENLWTMRNKSSEKFVFWINCSKMDRQENRLEKTLYSIYFWCKEEAVPVTSFISSILNVISHWKIIRILHVGLLAETSFRTDIDQ